MCIRDRGEVALTYVYGIGRSSSAEILDKAGAVRDLKVKDWTDDQAAKIREIIGAEYKVCLLYTSYPSVRNLQNSVP